MLKFLKKLSKFFCHICEYCCGNVQVLQSFHRKEHQKIITGPLNRVWHPLNFLASFRIYNKISKKIVSLVALWKFLNIFKVLFTF